MIARSLLAQTAAHEVKISYSYARRDESWRQEVDRLLPEFEWDVAVRTWYDGEIEPGAEWASEIDRNLAAADVILLFVGQAFVDSRYCREVELPLALRRHALGEARVVPVILEETNPDWRTLEFSRLQVLPRNGVPISSWEDRGRALSEVVQGLVDLVVHQGLHHVGRMRWELHLDGSVAEFTNSDRLAASTEFRSITGDGTLRIVGVGPGSVVLTIESTQDALARARRAFEDGALAAVAGHQIRRIAPLFGSGVRASSTIACIKRPDPLPDVDRMLLPSRAFLPTLLIGIQFDEENPLHIDFVADNGQSRLKGDAFEVENRKLIDYFLTALAVQDEDLFVNLSWGAMMFPWWPSRGSGSSQRKPRFLRPPANRSSAAAKLCRP